MLYFILSRVGGGKTSYLQQLIADFIRAGSSDLTLLVPEQYSFATERAMLEKLGNAQADHVQVLSFSRLAQLLCKDCKPLGRPVTPAQRSALLSLALEDVQDVLTLYRKKNASPGFIREMLHFCDEMAQSGLDAQELLAASGKLRGGLLKQKLQDFALILDAYRLQRENRFYDESDLFDLLENKLRHIPHFKGKIVLLDAFHGFTQQELRVLAQILQQAKAVYVTLCTDDLHNCKDDTELFAHTKHTALQLKTLAQELRIPVAKPQYLSGVNKYNNFPPKYHRYHNPPLYALERLLYDPAALGYPDTCDQITLMEAADPSQECRMIAVSALRLIREQGLRCRDIAVIARNMDVYEAPLRAELRKCGLPVFEDKRQPVSTQPLMLFVRAAMEIAAESFSPDALLRYCKAPPCGLSPQESAALENYVFLWNLKGSGWLSPFTRHPEGFGLQWDDVARHSLAQLNALRESVVTPLLHFREACKDADGEVFARAVFDLLEECGAAQHLRQFSLRLQEDGESELALEQNRVWEILMELLDGFAQLLKGRFFPMKRMHALFELMLSTVTLGTIPQGLDEINLGSADRIRPTSPKAVFVAGLNDGVFPLAPTASGILNDKERSRLADIGLELSAFGSRKSAQERFYAYNAICCANAYVFLSCSQKDMSGESAAPSEIFNRVAYLFPNCRRWNTGALPSFFFAQDERHAFEELAAHYRENSVEAATLRTVLEKKGPYRNKLNALDLAAREVDFKLEDTALAQSLFGKNMAISASRAEIYYSCAFRYFCEYGLRAKPRRQAELDPLQRGNLLHTVLEFLFRNFDLEQLEQKTANERLNLIRARIAQYRLEQLEGCDEDLQLLAILERNSTVLALLLERLLEELRGSSFRPVDFELPIGIAKEGKEGIPPYCLTDEDGSSLTLRGAVDRVDLAELDGKRYVRIVDYKTSGKAFSFSEVMDGIKLQMLIYLFAICKNGQERYGALLPAGILYQGISAEPSLASRDASETQKQEKYRKATKASGFILKDTKLLLAMEKDGAGLYIPAKMDKKGAVSGTVISFAQLAVLQKEVDALLLDMARALRRGEIAALPFYKKRRDDGSCKYCAFAAVCLREADDPVREMRDWSDKDVLAYLDGEGAEDEKTQ